MNFKKICAFILLFVNVFTVTVTAKKDESTQYDYFDKILGYASEMYIDEDITKDEILNRTIKKYINDNPDVLSELLKDAFSQLDEYSEYYTFDEYIEYVNNLNHTFYGIGVMIQKDGDFVKITQVLDGGSAIAAGVLSGDYIVKVNGEDMHGKSIDYVQSVVTGELNSEVTITVLRGDTEYTYTLARKPVSETTVSHLVLDEETAYVNIINFAQKTAEEFKAVLTDLDSKGIYNIILDLRNNPGGYLDSAVDIAQMIIPKGIIVQTIYRQEENNRTYYSTLNDAKFSFAVLVNENTASAAEILTGAIQDSQVGKVFGINTYGKAVIQEAFNMRNGDSFKITTGKYLTRNGREINKIGLKPDFEVLNTTKPIEVSEFPQISYNEATSFGDTHENVSVIKERLAYLGYPVTDFSKNYDSALEAYVLDFQISKELKPTGALDRITMVQIENAFAQCEQLVDNQLYKAYEYFGGSEEKLDEILNKKTQGE